MEAPVVDERTLKRRQAAQTAREQKIQQMGKENYDQMRRDEERERRLRQKTQREAAAAAAEAQEENEGGVCKVVGPLSTRMVRPDGGHMLLS